MSFGPLCPALAGSNLTRAVLVCDSTGFQAVRMIGCWTLSPGTNGASTAVRHPGSQRSPLSDPFAPPSLSLAVSLCRGWLKQCAGTGADITSDCDADEGVYSAHHYLNHTAEEVVADVLRAGTDVDCHQYGPNFVTTHAG